MIRAAGILTFLDCLEVVEEASDDDSNIQAFRVPKQNLVEESSHVLQHSRPKP